MPEFSNTDTISAIATPPGAGGIGVVRVSGPNAKAILKALWRGSIPSSNFESRRLYLGEVSDTSGNNIDRVMAVLMTGPNTYTGEDVVEFSCHGSPVVLKKLLNTCVWAGARTAEPGEFTRRAFLAGKIDLAQAEAVADLIGATSERAARIANDQISGRLSNEINSISNDLADLRAEIEAFIDFPEEDVSLNSNVLARIDALKNKIQRLSESFSEGRIIKEGARVAIVGRPNAGKSSIFNRLVGCDRAIVHHAPGTTRDVIEETVSFDGLPFRLRDTAGLRDDTHEVEAMGVIKSREEIEDADIVVVVFDGSQKINDEEISLLKSIDTKKVIAIINKSDLPFKIETSDIKKYSPITVSAKSGQGIDEIIEGLTRNAFGNEGAGEGVVITNARHKSLLDLGNRAIQDAISEISAKHSAEFIAAHLRSAQDALGQITGAIATEDILNRIFSRFCIGK